MLDWAGVRETQEVAETSRQEEVPDPDRRCGSRRFAVPAFAFLFLQLGAQGTSNTPDRMKYFNCTMAVLLALAGAAHAALTECASVSEAREVAEKAHRDIMVLYTGTDWCPACVYLEQQILTQPAFGQAFDARLVKVEEIFPRTPAARATVSDADMERRLREMDAYRISSLPCAVLMDAQGRPYAMVQGAERSADAYIRRVEEALAVKERRDKALAAAAELHGLEKARALAAALELLPEAVRGQYTDVLREIESLDLENTLGYRGKADQEATVREMQDAFRQMRRGFAGMTRPEQLDACRAQVEDFMTRYPAMDPDMRQQCYRLICDGYALKHDWPHTYQYAVLAIEAAPQTDLAVRILKPLRENLERHFPGIGAEISRPQGQ